MKPAENRASDNDAMRLWWAGYRRLQIQRAVRSVPVVVAEELSEQRQQMALVQDDDVVETLLAKGPHYPFRDRVRQRRPVGRFVVFDANAGELAPEVSTVRVVPITDQVLRLTPPGGGFDHLPPDPGRRRARGDLALNQLSALVADEEEHIKGLEADRLHHEQVRRPDALDLIPQKRFPGLSSLPLGAPPSIAVNRSIADHDRQLEDFSADALGPHRGFSRDIRAISFLTSVLKRGRPSRLRDLQLQYRRQPLRCQPITVSGCTILSLRVHPCGQIRRTQTKRIRSRLRRRGFGLRRRSTSSWCRRTRFSSARSWRERQQSIRTRSSIKRKPNTGAGAYQGRARRGMDDPDRLLPPFSRSRSSSASGSWTRSLTSTRSRSSRSME